MRLVHAGTAVLVVLLAAVGAGTPPAVAIPRSSGLSIPREMADRAARPSPPPPGGAVVYVRYRARPMADRPTSVRRLVVGRQGRLRSHRLLAGHRASLVLAARAGRVIVRWRPDHSQRLLTSAGRMVGRLPVNCSSVRDPSLAAAGPRQPVICFPLAGRPAVLRILTWTGRVQRVDVRTSHVRRILDLGYGVGTALLDRSERHLYLTPLKHPRTLRRVDLRAGRERVLTRTAPHRAVMPVCITREGHLLAVRGLLNPSEFLLIRADRLDRLQLRTGALLNSQRIDRPDLPVQSASSGLVGCTANGRWLIATLLRPNHVAVLPSTTVGGHRIGRQGAIRAIRSDNT